MLRRLQYKWYHPGPLDLLQLKRIQGKLYCCYLFFLPLSRTGAVFESWTSVGSLIAEGPPELMLSPACLSPPTSLLVVLSGKKCCSQFSWVSTHCCQHLGVYLRKNDVILLNKRVTFSAVLNSCISYAIWSVLKWLICSKRQFSLHSSWAIIYRLCLLMQTFVEKNNGMQRGCSQCLKFPFVQACL